jgi:hypothetical protein
MGQAALTGRARATAQPVARAVARSTGPPEAEILPLIGAVYLAIAFIGFLRPVDTVIAAGPIFPSLFIGGTAGVIVHQVIPGVPLGLAFTCLLAATLGRWWPRRSRWS